jgi:hypothetical protein
VKPNSETNAVSGTDNNLPIYESSIVGEWTIHVDWNGITGDGDAIVNFHNDGTFDAGGKTGKWTQNGNIIIWNFDRSSTQTTYIGTINMNKMSGTMSDDDGRQGNWSADKRY